MRFWTREVAGWVLLGLGLYVFYRDYQLLTEGNHYVLEGAMLTVIGIFLFRGGIQLLKIAVAARVCMDAQVRQERDRAKPGVASSRPMAGRRSPPYESRRETVDSGTGTPRR
jgi:hypothetical protein